MYRKIVAPQRQDYKNKKQYYWLVQSLDAFNKVFNIVNIRVPLLALLEAKERGVINMKMLKDIVLYMENFHFAYTVILSKGTNRVEKHYSAFAIQLRKSNNKEDSNIIISDLKKNLESLYPSYEDFKNKFITLAFSKAENPLNVKTRYAVNKLSCYFENSELFDDKGSIEHILAETNDKTLNIGNLILLEEKLNIEAGNEEYATKKTVYEKSTYNWVRDFIANNVTWNENDINNRAVALSKIYYEKIFCRHV